MAKNVCVSVPTHDQIEYLNDYYFNCDWIYIKKMLNLFLNIV